MAKNLAKTVFECSSCGRTTAKWVGKCVECGEWNTVEERVVKGGSSLAQGRGVSRARDGATRLRFSPYNSPGPGEGTLGAVELTEISSDGALHMATGIDELDRVLGGGFVAGSTTLLAGDPGIGKSTLLLQAAAAIAETGRKVLYATGEEALEQIRIRASRLGVKGDDVFMAGTGDVLDIADQIAAVGPAVVIVDSIQTAFHPDLDSPAGTVSQIRECAGMLGEIGRSGGFALVLSGHVTKDGNIAGPRVLEHQVDAVLQMGGEPGGMLRVLHAVKNRFGPTDEVGVFEMKGEGLAGISDPSHLFMGQRGAHGSAVAGSAVALVVEGTRSLAVEVQALATPSSLASPRRVANGVEMSRLHLITAVLAKHMRLPVSNHDLVISVTGGLDIREPAGDLAIALAIASSMMDRPVDYSVAVAGEIGLAGELRSVARADRRVTEAARLGFEKCLLPEAVKDSGADGDAAIEVKRAANIAEAIRFALEPASDGAAAESVTEVRSLK